jgi:hypothetical protein
VIRFYSESTGDFLAIDTESNEFYLRNYGRDDFEGRATAIVGQVGSVCTTSISRGFLRKQCRRVPKSDVPAEWLAAIAVEDEPCPESTAT